MLATFIKWVKIRAAVKVTRNTVKRLSSTPEKAARRGRRINKFMGALAMAQGNPAGAIPYMKPPSKNHARAGSLYLSEANAALTY